MQDHPFLPGITSSFYSTSRLHIHALTSGNAQATPVVFIHGNVSSSRFFEETMLALPVEFRAIAPDLRGFGDTEPKPVDATRGLRDFSDDLVALLAHPQLDIEAMHLVGWSTGGGVAMQYAIQHPDKVMSLTLIAPISPFGFGGTKGIQGEPCWPDFAGSGGGNANPEFVVRLRAKDDGHDGEFAPRNIMNSFYFHPPFRAKPDREEVFVASVVSTRASDEAYPGAVRASENWPMVRPGQTGVNNACSPAYYNLSNMTEIDPKPPILWVRGAHDRIVSDTSMFDFGHLGKLGLVPGWPGDEIFPAQPMVSQMRFVLEKYRAQGGNYRECVFDDVGHAPHVEVPEAFQKALFSFLKDCG